MAKLKELLRVAEEAYYGGERRKDRYDAMPYIGAALGLLRSGAGPDENRADVVGARENLEGYLRRLQAVREALARLED